MTLVYLQLQLHKFLELVMTCSTNSKKNLQLEQSQTAPKSLPFLSLSYVWAYEEIKDSFQYCLFGRY
jgi:hypothetical protein